MQRCDQNKLLKWLCDNRKRALHLHSLNNYWFCYENEKEKLSAGLFRRIKIPNEKEKNDQINKGWIRVRIRMGFRVRIWHWIRTELKPELKSDTE